MQLLWLLQLQIALFHSSSSSSPPGTCSRLHQSGSRGDPGVAAAAERHRRERSLRGAWMGRPEAVMAGDIGDIGDGRWRCCFEVPSKTYPADSSTRETDTLCSFRARSQPHRTGANTLRAKRPLIPAPVPYHDSHTASSPHRSQHSAPLSAMTPCLNNARTASSFLFEASIPLLLLSMEKRCPRCSPTVLVGEVLPYL